MFAVLGCRQARAHRACAWRGPALPEMAFQGRGPEQARLPLGVGYAGAGARLRVYYGHGTMLGWDWFGTAGGASGY